MKCLTERRSCSGVWRRLWGSWSRMFNVTCCTLRWVHVSISYYKFICVLKRFKIFCQLSWCLSFLQEMVSVAVQNVQEMENIIKDPTKNGINSSSHNNGYDPYKHFVSKPFSLLLLLFRAWFTLLSRISLFPFLPWIFYICVCPCFAVLFLRDRPFTLQLWITCHFAQSYLSSVHYINPLPLCL